MTYATMTSLAPAPLGDGVPRGPATPSPGKSARPLAVATGLTKTYGSGDAAVQALGGVDLAFHARQFTAIMGPSGSGKSTLMHCLAGLDRPTTGSVALAGRDITLMSERQLTALRRTSIGFIFQAFNLVATLTASENITLPLELARRSVDRQWFAQVVEVLGLGPRLGHRPSQLSGGQQQRVACARALIARPTMVFADEPTGNLDSASSRALLGFLRRSVDELGQSLVMVTHDPHAASYADRVVFLADGVVVGDLDNPQEDAIYEVMHRLAGSGAAAGSGLAAGPASAGLTAVGRHADESAPALAAGGRL